MFWNFLPTLFSSKLRFFEPPNALCTKKSEGRNDTKTAQETKKAPKGGSGFRSPQSGVGRRDLFRFVPICSGFPVFFRFVPICAPCLREYPDLFRFAPFSSLICSDLFSEQIRTNQGNPFLPTPFANPRVLNGVDAQTGSESKFPMFSVHCRGSDLS